MPQLKGMKHAGMTLTLTDGSPAATPSGGRGSGGRGSGGGAAKSGAGRGSGGRGRGGGKK